MINRNTLISLALTSVLLTAGVSTAFAMQHEAHEKAEKLKKELSLTDDQTKKIESIFSETHKKAEELKESTKKQINEVLTPEQQKKFEEMKEERKEHKAMKNSH